LSATLHNAEEKITLLEKEITEKEAVIQGLEASLSKEEKVRKHLEKEVSRSLYFIKVSRIGYYGEYVENL